MEPPRAQVADRRTKGPALTESLASVRPRRARALDAIPLAVREAALAAGAVVLLVGRGDMFVLAVALGVATGSALTTLTVALAGVATLARVGSSGLHEIGGNQAVLGAAGVTGAPVAVAAAWASALSLVLAGRQRTSGAVLGALAGMLVAGPAVVGGMNSALVWTGGVAGGGAVGWLAAASPKRARWQPWAAVGVGVVAVGLGVTAGYH